MLEDDYGEDSEILAYWNEVIKNNKPSKELLKKISPINYVNKVKTTVLLIHATCDKVVPIKQSEIFCEELEDADKQVTYVEIKGDGHSLIKSESRLKALKTIDKFINNHMPY